MPQRRDTDGGRDGCVEGCRGLQLRLSRCGLQNTREGNELDHRPGKS